LSPPNDLAPGVTAPGPHSAGREASPSGTEGWVKYQLGPDPNDWAQFNWDVPWTPGAANTFKVTLGNDSMMMQVDGWVGSGPAEAPVVSVAKIA
jgi:hypothetical protein